MSLLTNIMASAAEERCHIVLAEGDDQRILDAAAVVAHREIAHLTLLGDEAMITAELQQRDVDHKIKVINPQNDPRLDTYVKKYSDIRGSRLTRPDEATEAIRNPLGFAAMMVREGAADGTIAGAVATTGDTIRAALRIIGKAPGAQMVSSFFLMFPKDNSGPFSDRVLFADCALVVEPDEHELADIALSSARSARSFLLEPPRVAMLSFSTAGSAPHSRVATVHRATEIVRQSWPELEITGEIQFDAAVDPAIRSRKAPDNLFQGMPNVFIFPNLDAANIGYKIAQRIGGMTAIGPVLQGLAKPANDLSRGCSVDDIVTLITVTSLQAAVQGRRQDSD